MTRISKKIISVLLVAMLALSVGCSSGSSTSGSGSAKSAPVKDTLVIANTYGEPGNLHPYNTISIPQQIILSSIAEPLVMVDEKGVPQPNLAESWTMNDKEIVFKLRKGVLFHNGEEMKASDVVFSLQELMIKSTAGLTAFFDAVDSKNIAAVDDYTVKIPLLKQDNTIMTYLSGNGRIVSKKAYESMGVKFGQQPVGTGPFMFDEWTVGDHITVKANAKYWGGAPKLSKVTFRTISEIAQAMTELETAGVDLMLGPQGTDVKRVQDGQVKNVVAFTKATAIARTNNINLNFNSEYIKNDKVRQAIAHSIDRENWVKIISPGVGVASYSIFTPGNANFDKSIQETYPYKYDLDKAKKLIADAGYANGLTLTLLTDSRPYHQATVELAQASLAKIGITVKVQTMELAKQKEVMTTGKGFDMYLLDTVSTGVDATTALWRDTHPKFAGVNSSHYHFWPVGVGRAGEYADALEKARYGATPQERADASKKAQKIIAEEAAWLPVNCIQGYVLSNANVEGLDFINGDSLWINNKIGFKSK